MSLDGLIAEIDQLCGADPTTLADREAVKTLHRQLARLDAVTTRATAAYDASGEWEGSRARSCASLIAAICKVPLPEARRRISNGRALRHMPLVEEAWLDLRWRRVFGMPSAATCCHRIFPLALSRP